jgi:hypothetical protein
MPLDILNVFGKAIVTLNGPQISIVAHRDGNVKNVGYEIRWGNCSRGDLLEHFLTEGVVDIPLGA